MEIIYKPPTEDKDECKYLEHNYLKCLKEKHLQDNLKNRKCKVENILWFETECPTRFNQYTNPEQLRQIFIEAKREEVNPQKGILQKKK